MNRDEVQVQAGMRGRWSIPGLFLLALAARVALVVQGGQFFFPDEARYVVSREAAALITQGKWPQGLALPFEGGDHVGFKFLGLVPALAERAVGISDWLPAIFWSSFSAGTVVLVALLARRLGGSASAQRWSALAALTSATLFYYSRHLLPYDAAMCLVLAAWYVATGGAGWGRAYLGGLLAGGAFAIYYGYWPMVGVVLTWATLGVGRALTGWVVRGAVMALGALTPVAAAWAINVAWGSGQMLARARTFSGTINQGDYQASVTTWGFLLRAEALWVVAAVALGGFAVIQWRRAPASSRGQLAPVVWAAVAAAVIWLLFIVTGDLLHKFTVYGRLIRQMTPFLSLGLGFGAAAWLESRPNIWRWLLAGLLVANAAVLMGRACRIQFPADFRRHWEPFLTAHQGEQAEPAAYYRMVNATRYFHEVEDLRGSPLETVAATQHPLTFEPYLYELFAADQRERRRAADHRLRVVKMPVAPGAVVTGEAHGTIRLKVRFTDPRPGFSQPLLSAGPYHGGELFFVQYLSATRARFGCELYGRAVFFSEEQEIGPDQVYEVGCFSGSMLPPAGDTSPGAVAARQPRVGNQLVITLNGRDLIRRLAPATQTGPAQAYAGANVIGAESAGAEFSGEILAVARGGFPPPLVLAGEIAAYGAVKLRVSPPIARAGSPEPLTVVGDPGRAVLGFMVPLQDGRVQIGVEIWGVGATKSAPVKLRGDESDEVTFEFGSLFPPEGAPEWGSVPPAEQAEKKRTVVIRLNGRVLVKEVMPTPELGPTTASSGRNPVGGSYVGEAFSGKVLTLDRLKLPEATTPASK